MRVLDMTGRCSELIFCPVVGTEDNRSRQVHGRCWPGLWSYVLCSRCDLMQIILIFLLTIAPCKYVQVRTGTPAILVVPTTTFV